jgi:hypothetical protein
MRGRKEATLIVAALAGLSAATNVSGTPAWAEQGSGPILNGDVQGLSENPVAGAINALSRAPTQPISSLPEQSTVASGKRPIRPMRARLGPRCRA